MTLKRSFLGALAFCAALSAPLASLAALVGPVETTRAAFDLRVGTQGTDSFDDLTVGGLGTSLPGRPAGTFFYTAAATNGLYALAGVRLTTDTAPDSLTLSAFSSGVHGFGADFFVDPSTSAGTLTFEYNGGVIHTLNIPANAPLGLFVGFVFDSAIDAGEIKITSSQTGGEVFLVMDNLTLATAVPEVGTFPLMVVGAAALFAASLRRRRAA